MSRFLHTRYAGLETYTPGEQPRDQAVHQTQHQRVPLSPLPGGSGGPGPGEVADLRLYSDPEGTRAAGEAGGAVQRDAGPGLSVQWVGRHFELRVHGLWGERRGISFPDVQFLPRVLPTSIRCPMRRSPSGRTFPWMWRGCRERESSRCWPTPTPPRVCAAPGSGGGPWWPPIPAMWWWWMRPMWTSAPRPPRRCWVGMRTFWW